MVGTWVAAWLAFAERLQRLAARCGNDARLRGRQRPPARRFVQIARRWFSAAVRSDSRCAVQRRVLSGRVHDWARAGDPVVGVAPVPLDTSEECAVPLGRAYLRACP